MSRYQENLTHYLHFPIPKQNPLETDEHLLKCLLESHCETFLFSTQNHLYYFDFGNEQHMQCLLCCLGKRLVFHYRSIILLFLDQFLSFKIIEIFLRSLYLSNYASVLNLLLCYVLAQDFLSKTWFLACLCLSCLLLCLLIFQECNV